MSRYVFVVLAALSAVVMSGCASTGMMSKTGFAVIAMQTEGDDATAHASASKSGEACSMNILGIYSGGDSSITAAKKAGGVNTVSAVDTKYFNILGIYGTVCTIVSGS